MSVTDEPGTAGDGTSFVDGVKALIGVEEPGPTLVARDEVNEAMIRHWCDAMGDDNPVYTDPKVAGSSIHGGIVAPPVMLQVWTMQGLAGRRAPVEEAASRTPQEVLNELCREHGFTSVVATNCEQEYPRYLRPGDRLTAYTTIDDVSEKKSTGLGTGHFVTTRITYRDQDGAEAGAMLFRTLRFAPAVRGGSPPPEPAGEASDESPRRPRPAITRDSAFFWEGVDRGELCYRVCSSCGLQTHPPKPMCPSCNSLEWDVAVASGLGRIYSFVRPHHPAVGAFEQPYVVALVELDEGLRIVSNIIDIDPAEVAIGMSVEVDFVAVDPELTLPQFRPVQR